MKSKRLHNIKRYENYLKRSLDTSVSIQISPSDQNQISYQFKHFQLKKKPLNSKNLSKKSSLSHLVSADSTQLIPELKFNKCYATMKRSKERFYENFGKFLSEYNKNYRSSVSLAGDNKRPKSFSPALQNKNGRRGLSTGKGFRSIRIEIKKPDIELGPW